MVTETNETLFTAKEWVRYTRHIQLSQLGVEGQIKLKRSCVVIVGAGGLGAPVSLYLAAAGVGCLRIIDHDQVDLSNLQRQILFTESDLGKNKSRAAVKRLNALNTDITLEAISQSLSPENASEHFKGADLVIDCTDNFDARYAINQACLIAKIPWVSAAIRKFSAQIMGFAPNTPCFQCLYPYSPQNTEDCNSAGVLGVLPGMAGTIQASESIKILSGIESSIIGETYLFDALKLDGQRIKLSKNPTCPVCSNQIEKEIPDHSNAQTCSTSTHEYEIPKAKFDELAKRQATLVLDVRDQLEHQGFNLGGCHVPLNSLDKFLSSNETQANQFVCYCQSGKRSQKAAELLRERGFKAYSLEGGILAYLKGSPHQQA